MVSAVRRHLFLDAAISRLLRWTAALGDATDEEWADAVLAEGTALEPPARRRWTLGGLWFLSGRRRASLGQQGFSLLGLAYATLVLSAAVADLRDDAPDLLLVSDVLILVGAGSLAIAFGIAVARPLRGVLLGVPALALYAVLMMTENRIEAARRLAPVAPFDLADLTFLAFLYVTLVLGVPFLVFAGIAASGLFPPAPRIRREEDLDGTTA